MKEFLIPDAIRNIIFFLTWLFLSTVSFAQDARMVSIRGKVSGDTKGRDLIYVYASGRPSDSVAVKRGKFFISIPVTETTIIRLVTQYDKNIRQSYKPFYLLLDGNGNVQLDMDIEKGFFHAAIKGSHTAIAYNAYIKQRDSVYVKVGQLLKDLHGKSYASPKDPLYVPINSSRDSLLRIYMGALIRDFIQANRNEYVGLYVLNNEGKTYLNIDGLDQLIGMLSPSIREHQEALQLIAHIRGVRNTRIGSAIPNFILNDPTGKPISFDQFKGKYVWIDFWASWCGPCKKAFPHMKELYQRYKDKGLEILGISADAKIEPWLKILPSLQNPWVQVWDNKNIMYEFAITAFPTSFLVGPDGRILIKEVGYEPNGSSPIDKKLIELFDSVK